MKKIIIVFMVGLLTQQTVQAQGTVYLSNLGQTADGDVAVAGDSWLAGGFRTGTNAGGYLLDSVQLAMADASGSPSSFTVMLYSFVTDTGFHPGSSLATLNGSSNPSTAGIFDYSPALSLLLSPNTGYFVVLTAGTTVADGAYQWNVMNTTSYDASDGWIGSVALISYDNGSGWLPLPTYPNMDFSQFAINVTAVPEPGILGLFALGGLFLVCPCRKIWQELLEH
jgi:hypothetical protein